MFRISENLENPCDECEEVGAEKVETETTHENSNFLLRFWNSWLSILILKFFILNSLSYWDFIRKKVFNLKVKILACLAMILIWKE